jgi:uncharacterized protein
MKKTPRSTKPSAKNAKASKPAPAPRVAKAPPPKAPAKSSKPVKPSKPAAPATKVTSPTKPAVATKKSPAPPAKPVPAPKPVPVAKTAPTQKPIILPKPAPIPKTPPMPAFKGTAKPEPVIPPEKDLTTRSKPGLNKDRLVLMVPDPFWIHAVWEISHASVLRAESALGPDWHGARPIIRLFDVTSADTTSTSEAPIRDMVIHGGCTHWWIDVPQPPRSYRCDVGYVSKRGQFYMLARSNVVTPPKAGATEIVDDAWTSDIEKAGGADRVLAMSTGFESTTGPSQLKEFFEEQFKKPHKEGMFGAGAIPGKMKKFHFDLDAELVVRGQTEPNATVTLQNERVPLRPDGSFTMRFSLPDSRQIIPAVSTSADGLEEQTIVLAVERNIKRLDVMTHDMNAEL